MFRLLITVSDSWRPPALSHGLPGARCMSVNVIRMTKNRIGIIQRIRRTMKIVRAPDLVLVIARSWEGSGAPRMGRPAVAANSVVSFSAA